MLSTESKFAMILAARRHFDEYPRLYWLPTDAEFSTSNGWPSGWQTPNTQINAVTARLPSTNTPSPDGKRYLDESYSVIGQLLKAQGYSETEINTNRNQKDVGHQHQSLYFLYTNTLARTSTGTPTTTLKAGNVQE